jgi:uncharacterized membrane protein YkoI
MTSKLKGALIAVAAVAALAVGGTAIARAAGGSDNERPITGSALDKAGAAALDHTGGGQVSDTEVGDEEGYYEVEVTRSDGSQVDVHLDRGFNVLSQVSDSDGQGDKDSANEK